MSEQLKELLGPRIKESKNNLDPRIPRSQKQTERIADQLVDKFKSPGYRPFFLKVAWRFDEDTINRNVATALERATNPRAYFIAVMKREKAYYTG